MGMSRCASHSNQPDRPIEMMAPVMPQTFSAGCCDSLKPTGQPISNTPASMR